MATLTIRNVPRGVHDKLRIRAAEHGKSMEAEVREILARELFKQTEDLTDNDLQEFVYDLYDGKLPSNVVDDLITERREEERKE